jgi:hypothetical protein
MTIIYYTKSCIDILRMEDCRGYNIVSWNVLRVGLYKIIRMVRLGECKLVSRFQTSIGQQKGNVVEKKDLTSN